MAVELPRLDLETLSSTAAFGWELLYTQTSPVEVSADRRLFQTSRLQLSTTRYNAATLIEGAIPRDAILFSSVPQASEIHCTFRKQPVRSHELITYYERDEVDFFHDDACTVYTLAVEHTLLKKAFYDYFGVEFEEHIRRGTLKIPPETLRVFARELDAWLDHGFTLSDQGIPLQRYRKIEQDILDTLFQYIDYKKGLGLKERSVFLLEKARHTLHNNLRNDYTIAELATEMGMSKRNLQLLFKRYLGTTPKRYFQNIRFQAVREELLRTWERERIGEIARRYDFAHMGHFSNEYKKLFGESPPSRTLHSSSAKR